MYEGDTLSENAAHHMQVSSTSSQWRKCIFHDLGVYAYLAMHEVTNHCYVLVSSPWY